MIKTGETITIETVALTKNNLADIRPFHMYLTYHTKIRQ